MSIESGLIEQLQHGVIEQLHQDVTITSARYAELIRAEHDANCLKELIKTKADHYDGFDRVETKLLRDLYFFPDESEEK